MDNLDHHLARLDALYDILTKSHFLYIVAEALGYLVAHVGLDQGPADVFEGFGYVNFSNPALSFQQAERPV